jgi:hypothetical protein
LSAFISLFDSVSSEHFFIELVGRSVGRSVSLPLAAAAVSAFAAASAAADAEAEAEAERKERRRRRNETKAIGFTKKQKAGTTPSRSATTARGTAKIELRQRK